MIIPNLIIGHDKHGHPLKCGDICSFIVTLQDDKDSINGTEYTLKGMIIYDEDSYAYAFETLFSKAPLLLMYTAEYRTIEKLFDSNETNFEFIPDGDKWREIYKNNIIPHFLRKKE